MMEDDGLSSWYTDTSASASDESPMKSVQESPSTSSNSDGANNQYPSTLIRPAGEDWNVVSPSPSYIITGTTVHSSSQQSNNASSSFPGSTTISPMSVVETAGDIRSSPLPSIPPLSFEHQHQHQHEPPALPTTLGTSMHNYQQKNINDNRRHRNNYSTTRTNNDSHSHTRFVEKSKLEQQREKIASRRVQSMMMEGCRNAARSRQKAEEKREKHKLLLLPLPHRHYQQHASSFGKREAKLHLLPSGMEYLASSSSSRSSTSTSTKERTPPLILEDLTGSVNDFKNGFEKDRERAAQKQAMKMILRLTNAA